MAKKEADDKAAKEQAEADAKAKKEADDKAAKEQAEADAKAKKEADDKAAQEQADADAKAKKEADDKAKKEADDKAADEKAAAIAAREADDKAARERQTASELEAMGVPLSKRRAAGAAAAAAADDDELVVAGEIEEDDEASSLSTTPAMAAVDLAAPVVAAAGAGGADWNTAASELSAEASDASGKKNAERRAVLEYEVGRVLAYRTGDWDAARPHFQAALEAKADFVPAIRELVRLAVSQKDWDGAVDLLAKQAAATSDSVGKTAALLTSAHIQLTEQKDKQESASKVLNQALEVHGENYTALRFLRVIYYDREEYTPLISVLEKARALAGQGEQLRLDYEIGRVHDEVLQDSAAALEVFRRALAENGQLIPAFLYAEQLLTAGGNKAGLVDLWRQTSEAWGDADKSWWRSRAARLADMAGADADTIAKDWEAAVGAAGVQDFLAEEYRHWLQARGRNDELAVAAELALDGVSDDRERAALCAVLGEVALDAGDGAAAGEWFDKALAADASCVPAREGRRRVPAASGDWDALVGQFEAAREAASSTRVKLALRLKQAEVALDRKNDPASAREHLEAAVELAPNYLPAVDSLVHVLQALSEDASCAERLEQASNLVDSDAARSTYLLRSARAWLQAGKADKASEMLERAAKHAPGLLLGREWQAEAFVSAERWADAAKVLRQAATETEDAALRVSLLYRSARLFLARADDADSARATYGELLELVPDFLPATMDLRDMALGKKDWDGLAALLEQESDSSRDTDATAWWNIAAGQAFEKAGKTEAALTRYRAALGAVHGHPVAHAALRRVYRTSGDWAALVSDLKDQLAGANETARRDALRLQLVAALEQLGEPGSVASEISELLKSDGLSELPLPSLGIICEGLQAWDQAVAVYAAAGAQEDAADGQRAACFFQQGLLREEGFEDHEGAAELYTKADELVGHHPMALENLETIYGNTNDRQGLARVYGRQAERAGSRPVQTFYALLAGDEHERLGNIDKAVEAYTMAFADPVGRERAYEALRRITLKSEDAATLREVTAELAGDGKAPESLGRWMELGDGLLSINKKEEAIAAYQEVADRDPSYLSAWHHLERLHSDNEEWNSVLAALDGLAEHAKTEGVKKAVAARTENLLEDKGVTSDSAWDFYTKRLGDDPTNVVALRGLAGIALGRDDTKDAKKYYETLAKSANEPVHLAEAESQLGVIALKGKRGADKKAIEHFEKALEHVPAWRPATDGLRAVYERTKNWKALVGVVARESTAAPERRVELHAEIARLWQDRIDEPRIATASWQKVLQEDPTHAEALERLLGLYEAAGDWPKYLDIADKGLATLEGEALRDRNAELGIVAHERAGQTDRAIAYLKTAIAPEPPSISALETLRRIERAKGDWDGVIALTERQADNTEDKATQVELFVDAAKIKLDQLLDREGAASLFGRAYALDETCVPALEFFVNWHYDAGSWTEAAKAFAGYEATVEGKDLEEDDDDRMEATAFYFKYGSLLVHINDPDGVAIDKFARALELTPTHLPSLEAAAPRYVAAERWEEARTACRSILRLRGGMGDSEAMTELYLNLGTAETKLGDTKNSLKRFKKALDLSQNNVAALLGIAGVHKATGEWNSLLSTYNSIIKYARDPDQVIRAYLTKGDVLERKLAIVDKAVLHYEKVLMYDKNNVSAMTRLGQIALKRGDASGARDFSARALEAARDDDDRRMGLLLQGLVDGGDPVDVTALVKKVGKEVGEGTVLEAFSLAAGKGKVALEKAAEAFAQATTSV
ncbi:MAG: hypothetical protein KDA24_27700, partial [Deltaproteobacteria bacterium]|nr:hypothetical protein [Deltaproteobacteria bacterium]